MRINQFYAAKDQYKIFLLSFLMIAVCSTGCKKPFDPSIITKAGNYLVVEGVINTGDSTFIKLSRTVHISSDSTPNPETGATVSVENDQNGIFPLKEIKKGVYAASNLNLDTTKKYRLRIQTIGNQLYTSDFEAVKITPPIDSVGFTITSEGMQVYVNTHDPKNNTHFYRWDYQETWTFFARYPSDYYSDGKEILPRTNEQEVFSCFANDTSSNIILGSSAKLALDVINQNLITTISSSSEKIELEYSILLKQYALTSDAYSFYANLQKNTEQLGSIFDAQPSSLKGNIHNVNNAAEPVIGYVSVCSVSEKRIFIANHQLPDSWVAIYPYDCQIATYLYYNPKTGVDEVDKFLLPQPNSLWIATALPSAGFPPPGYTASSRECVDCTLRGYIHAPSFWKTL